MTKDSEKHFVEYNGNTYYVEKNSLCLYSCYIKKISDIKSLDKLRCLKKLDLRNNEIVEIEGLESLQNLEVLDLSGNQISKIEGLEELRNLEELILSFNKINNYRITFNNL